MRIYRGQGNSNLVQDPPTGGWHEVQLHATAFPVDDSAINGQPGSVQDVMAQFQPHAVLSLGYMVIS